LKIKKFKLCPLKARHQAIVLEIPGAWNRPDRQRDLTGPLAQPNFGATAPSQRRIEH
jgi:hypothetical protein